MTYTYFIENGLLYKISDGFTEDELKSDTLFYTCLVPPLQGPDLGGYAAYDYLDVPHQW